MEKSYLYEREQRQKLRKEAEEERLQEKLQEYDSSDDDEDEENFGWMQKNDSDNYLVLATKHKNAYEKGQQVFHCYGRRTNRFLLVNYGFCLENNKYNSLNFRVWINFDWKKGTEAKLREEGAGDPNDEDSRISKLIRLKGNKINEDILAYLRANLLNTYSGKNLHHLLISTPVDCEFELLVIACCINLLKGLVSSRFKGSAKEDAELLKDPTLSSRHRFAIIHRKSSKEIIEGNLKLCQILLRILARMVDGKPFKKAYMMRVEEAEEEEEVMLNRLNLRHYLRELLTNQRRIAETAQNEGPWEQTVDDGGF